MIGWQTESANKNLNLQTNKQKVNNFISGQTNSTISLTIQTVATKSCYGSGGCRQSLESFDQKAKIINATPCVMNI